jgi:hypothetical protein
MKTFRYIELKFLEILLAFTFIVFFYNIVEHSFNDKSSRISISFFLIGIYQQLRFVLLPWRGDFKKHRIQYLGLLVLVYLLPFLNTSFSSGYGIINQVYITFYFLYCIFVMFYFYLICKREHQAIRPTF